jgi:Protein of unknown function (DUF998)
MKTLRALAPALAGPAAFFGASIAGARRESGYSHRDEPMSALAAHGTRSGPVMVGGFLALAACTLALGRAVRGSRLPAVIAPMMTLTGLTIAGAGLARCSDRTCPTRGLDNGDPKLTDDLHMAFSAPTFVLWTAMPLVAGVFGTRLAAVDRKRALMFGAASVATVVANSALLSRGVDKRGGGWSQRAFVGTALAWYPFAAVAAFRR